MIQDKVPERVDLLYEILVTLEGTIKRRIMGLHETVHILSGPQDVPVPRMVLEDGLARVLPSGRDPRKTVRLNEYLMNDSRDHLLLHLYFIKQWEFTEREKLNDWKSTNIIAECPIVTFC